MFYQFQNTYSPPQSAITEIEGTLKSAASYNHYLIMTYMIPKSSQDTVVITP